MDQVELQEIETLKAKCLKLDGDVRKTADSKDLQRLQDLLSKQQAEQPVATVTPPDAGEANPRITELEDMLRDAQKLCDKEREGRVKAEQRLRELGEPVDGPKVVAIGPTGAPVTGPVPTGPLTFDERQELDELERRARKGRQIAQPDPIEMRRLGHLRARSNK